MGPFQVLTADVRLEFLAGSWTEGLGSLLAVTEAALSCLPHGSVHRAADNMAACSSQPVRRASIERLSWQMDVRTYPSSQSDIQSLLPHCIG